MSREKHPAKKPKTLTHLDAEGQVRMVNVTSKDRTSRRAVAESRLRLSTEAFTALKEGSLKKGDAIAVARIAGICGAKQTSTLIPLCHPLPITGVEVAIELIDSESIVRIEATVTVDGKTGVEMEALTAVSIAGLTIYDMCKAIDKSIIIESTRLLMKEGGTSGIYRADPETGS